MAVRMAVPTPLVASGTPVALAEGDPLPYTRPLSDSAVSAVRFAGDRPESFVIAESILPSVQPGKSLATEKQEEELRLAKQREEESRKRLEAERLQKEREKQRLAIAAAVQPISYSPGSVQALVREATVANFGEGEVQAMFNIISRESGFNPNAVNRSSGACGLFQALPCAKMGGLEVNNQVRWGMGYIKARYGTPTRAWNFWLAHHWY